MSQSTT